MVSIITPTYNRANYLVETIESVLSQGYPNLEYILLDDGSKDNTLEILEKYNGKIWWESHPNMGETRTVNKGFKLSHGEFICVVNSDDPLLPGAIMTAIDILQRYPEALVAYPNWDYISSDSSFLLHTEVPSYDYLFMITRHKCIVGAGAFFRRLAFDLIGGRDPSFKYVADFDFWLRLGLYGYFVKIPKTLGTFRVHPDSASLSMKGVEMADEDIRLVNKIYSLPNLPEKVIKGRSRAFSNAHLHASRVCGENRKESFKHYLYFIIYYPQDFVFELLLFIRKVFSFRSIAWLKKELAAFRARLP